MTYEDSSYAAMLGSGTLPYSIAQQRREKLFEKYILTAKISKVKVRPEDDEIVDYDYEPTGYDEKGPYTIVELYRWPLDNQYIMENYDVEDSNTAAMIFDAITCPDEIKMYIKLKWAWDDDEIA